MTSTVRVLRSPEEAAIVLDPIRLKLLENLEQPGSAASLSRVLNLPRQARSTAFSDQELDAVLAALGCAYDRAIVLAGNRAETATLTRRRDQLQPSNDPHHHRL